MKKMLMTILMVGFTSVTMAQPSHFNENQQRRYSYALQKSKEKLAYDERKLRIDMRTGDRRLIEQDKRQIRRDREVVRRNEARLRSHHYQKY